MNIFNSILIVFLCVSQVTFSQRTDRSRQQTDGSTQQDTSTTNRRVTKVDKANEQVDDVNTGINNTNESLDNTVNSSKETVANVKETFTSIFGTGKKKNTEKQLVIIQITNVTYDDEGLTQFYNRAKKVRGVKNPSKTFKAGNALIELEYKKGADALFQEIPKNIRSSFKIIEISDTSILLQHSKN